MFDSDFQHLEKRSDDLPLLSYVALDFDSFEMFFDFPDFLVFRDSDDKVLMDSRRTDHIERPCFVSQRRRLRIY
jgi:hypothetical protein